jgi:uncharacterized membrane protein
MENIVTVIFKVESQGYQALTELKQDPYRGNYLISGMTLVKKEKEHIVVKDGFDTGIQTTDDTVLGGLIGGLVGILGGPIGMLLGGSVGILAGTVADTGDIAKGATMVEKVSTAMKDGDLALIVLVQETDETSLDSQFKKYETIILRRDAATVQDEIKEAERIRKELEKQAKKELRAQKSAERKTKIEKQKAQIKQAFEDFKQKHPVLPGKKAGSK